MPPSADVFVHVRHGSSGPTVAGAPLASFGRPGEGPWARWHWDGHELVVETDPLGHQPLYWWDGPGEVAVSDSVLPLLALGAPGDLDHAALAVFLRLGWFVAEDTAFAAVRALPPDARLHWSEDGVELSGGPMIVPLAPMGRDEALDGFVTLFRTAVRRRLPDRGVRPAIALSGGMDSRHVLLELVAAGVHPTCVTARFPAPRDDVDVDVAGQVAGALDLPHEVVASPRSRLDAERRKRQWTSFSTQAMAWTVPLADHLAGRADLVYDGIGGDVLSAGFLQRERHVQLLADGRLDELARDLLALRHREPVLDQILTPTARRQLGLEVAVQRLSLELPRHTEAANPLGSFFFWNQERRELATRPSSVFARVADVATPFLDLDLVRHLASLPATMTNTNLGGHDFHADAIRLGHPDAPGVPWSRERTSRRDPSGARRYAVEAAAHVARHPSELVRRPTLVGGLLRRMVDGRLAHRRDPLALHLLHLEEVAGQSSG